MTYYVRERWQLERNRDVLSPPPAQATALHCPKCGAPLQKDTVGACAFCGTRIESGEFQWYVRGIALLGSEVKRAFAHVRRARSRHRFAQRGPARF